MTEQLWREADSPTPRGQFHTSTKGDVRVHVVPPFLSFFPNSSPLSLYVSPRSLLCAFPAALIGGLSARRMRGPPTQSIQF